MENNQVDILDAQFEKKLPEILNVLTILTLIACGIGLITSIWTFTHAEASYENVQRVNGSMKNMPGFVQDMVGPDALERARRMYENRLPILIFGLGGLVCCTIGALMMRKQKKAGYFFWLIGELVPLTAFTVVVNLTNMSGYIFKIDLLIIGVFVALYTTQYKHLGAA
jgi:hypothetical protein